MVHKRSRKTVPCPAHLKGSAKEFFERVQRDYEISDPGGEKLLQLAAECLQTGEDARKVLEVEGNTYLDKWGQPKKRPEVDIARNAAVAFGRLTRELRLGPPAESEGAR